MSSEQRSPITFPRNNLPPIWPVGQQDSSRRMSMKQTHIINGNGLISTAAQKSSSTPKPNVSVPRIITAAPISANGQLPSAADKHPKKRGSTSAGTTRRRRGSIATNKPPCSASPIASTSKQRLDSHSASPQIPHSALLSEEVETEEDAIRCICNLPHDDGFSIACDVCGRWCHCSCFGILSGQVPEKWVCWICGPDQHVDLLEAVQEGRVSFDLAILGSDGETLDILQQHKRKPRQRRNSTLASPVDSTHQPTRARILSSARHNKPQSRGGSNKQRTVEHSDEGENEESNKNKYNGNIYSRYRRDPWFGTPSVCVRPNLREEEEEGVRIAPSAWYVNNKQYKRRSSDATEESASDDGLVFRHRKDKGKARETDSTEDEEPHQWFSRSRQILPAFLPSPPGGPHLMVDTDIQVDVEDEQELRRDWPSLQKERKHDVCRACHHHNTTEEISECTQIRTRLKSIVSALDGSFVTCSCGENGTKIVDGCALGWMRWFVGQDYARRPDLSDEKEEDADVDVDVETSSPKPEPAEREVRSMPRRFVKGLWKQKLSKGKEREESANNGVIDTGQEQEQEHLHPPKMRKQWARQQRRTSPAPLHADKREEEEEELPMDVDVDSRPIENAVTLMAMAPPPLPEPQDVEMDILPTNRSEMETIPMDRSRTTTSASTASSNNSNSASNSASPAPASAYDLFSASPTVSMVSPSISFSRLSLISPIVPAYPNSFTRSSNMNMNVDSQAKENSNSALRFGYSIGMKRKQEEEEEEPVYQQEEEEEEEPEPEEQSARISASPVVQQRVVSGLDGLSLLASCAEEMELALKESEHDDVDAEKASADTTLLGSSPLSVWSVVDKNEIECKDEDCGDTNSDSERNQVDRQQQENHDHEQEDVNQNHDRYSSPLTMPTSERSRSNSLRPRSSSPSPYPSVAKISEEVERYLANSSSSGSEAGREQQQEQRPAEQQQQEQQSQEVEEQEMDQEPEYDHDQGSDFVDLEVLYAGGANETTSSPASPEAVTEGGDEISFELGNEEHTVVQQKSVNVDFSQVESLHERSVSPPPVPEAEAEPSTAYEEDAVSLGSNEDEQDSRTQKEHANSGEPIVHSDVSQSKPETSPPEPETRPAEIEPPSQPAKTKLSLKDFALRRKKRKEVEELGRASPNDPPANEGSNSSANENVPVSTANNSNSLPSISTTTTTTTTIIPLFTGTVSSSSVELAKATEAEEDEQEKRARWARSIAQSSYIGFDLDPSVNEPESWQPLPLSAPAPTSMPFSNPWPSKSTTASASTSVGTITEDPRKAYTPPAVNTRPAIPIAPPRQPRSFNAANGNLNHLNVNSNSNGFRFDAPRVQPVQPPLVPFQPAKRQPFIRKIFTPPAFTPPASTMPAPIINSKPIPSGPRALRFSQPQQQPQGPQPSSAIPKRLGRFPPRPSNTMNNGPGWNLPNGHGHGHSGFGK